MKNILTLLMICAISAGHSQKMMTKNGKVTFEASVPGFEEVRATHNNATCVLNASNGEIASLILMKGFKFEIALMEEHFNDNYVESDRYPKATLKGRIEGFNAATLTETAQDYNIKGKMEIHGKSKEVTIPSKIRKTADGIEIISDFNVNSDDYNIEIPAVVRSKVSKKVSIHCEFTVK